jgi:mannose-6-phosphate isomerase-like protein (cupin superfamily)
LGAEEQEFKSRSGVPATLPWSERGFDPMQYKHLKFGKGFRVVLGNKRSQAAQMTIPCGSSEGGPGNRHRKADQWLFVVSGKGFATVGKERIALRAGSLLLIEHGETHEITSSGRSLLKTLNFYVPPGFTIEGAPLPSARP